MNIAVIGGTGRIGARLVRVLTAAGHEAVPHARSTGLDVHSGAGLDSALEGADVVVDTTGSPTTDEAAIDFYQVTTDNLLAAAQKSGVRHAVVLSIVGIDEASPYVPYYRAKIRQEDVLRSGPIPYSIVRATQFFEFIDTIMSWTTEAGTVHLPTTRMQPIAADDVAAALADVATGTPLMGIRNIAGPEVFPLDELGRMALAARGDHRTVTTTGRAGLFGKVPDGAIIGGDDVHVGPTHYRDWLNR